MVELLACVLVCLEGWRSNCKRRRFIVGISRAGDDGSLHGYQEIDAFVEINLTTFSNQPRGIRRLLFPHTFLLTTHNLAISRVEILLWLGLQPLHCFSFSRMTVAGAIIHLSLHATIPTKQNIR